MLPAKMCDTNQGNTTDLKSASAMELQTWDLGQQDLSALWNTLKGADMTCEFVFFFFFF